MPDAAAPDDGEAEGENVLRMARRRVARETGGMKNL